MTSAQPVTRRLASNTSSDDDGRDQHAVPGPVDELAGSARGSGSPHRGRPTRLTTASAMSIEPGRACSLLEHRLGDRFLAGRAGAERKRQERERKRQAEHRDQHLLGEQADAAAGRECRGCRRRPRARFRRAARPSRARLQRSSAQSGQMTLTSAWRRSRMTASRARASAPAKLLRLLDPLAVPALRRARIPRTAARARGRRGTARRPRRPRRP